MPLIEIPGHHRFARSIHEHPAVTSVHTVLVEQVASDVVTGNTVGWNILCLQLVNFVNRSRRLDRRDILHHQIAARIANPERFTFGVEPGESEVSLVAVMLTVYEEWPIRVLKTVVCNRDHVAAQTIENRERRRAFVYE